MRISDWSSDVCSSDLPGQVHLRARPQRALLLGPAQRFAAAQPRAAQARGPARPVPQQRARDRARAEDLLGPLPGRVRRRRDRPRSEEHTSELQSLMRISYAVFCLKKKKTHTNKRKLDKEKQRSMTSEH